MTTPTPAPPPLDLAALKAKAERAHILRWVNHGDVIEAFHAAANPQAVLELVAMVEAWKVDAERLAGMDWCDHDPQHGEPGVQCDWCDALAAHNTLLHRSAEGGTE